MTNPLLELRRRRPGGLARLRRPQVPRGRRAAEAGRRGRADRRHLQPVDLRKGDGRRATPMTPRSRRRWRRGDPDAATTLYERLAIDDIQAAADTFRPVYDRLGGEDGYVSLEVSPYLADDTEATIAEARRLWRGGRPAEPDDQDARAPRAGVPAIRQLIGEGINVNVTLLFALDAYQAVAEALRRRAGGAQAARRRRLARSPASPASSSAASTPRSTRRSTRGWRPATRDGRGAEGAARQGRDRQRQDGLPALSRADRRRRAGRRWPPRARSRSGCSGRRPAPRTRPIPTRSTSTTLIGPDTVNTMPPKTMDAFRDHGTRRRRR